MRKFTPETAAEVVALQQLVLDWGRDLDVNDGANVTQYFTEDCVVDSGAAMRFKGREAMKQFYTARNERVRTLQKDGIRTQRHGITNVRVTLGGPESATITFLIINFSGEGKPPVFNGTVPTIVTDVRFECRRGTDGLWRIAEFHGTPIFIGNDPFLNAAMVGQRTGQ